MVLSSALIGLVGAACSLVYSPEDLSNGHGGADAGVDHDASTNDVHMTEDAPYDAPVDVTMVECTSAAQCDDGKPCTIDDCPFNLGKCTHALAAPGTGCGKGNDCVPDSTCTADGTCAPGQPDPSKCDDNNECTIDTCGVSGCSHAPNTGAPCSDKNPCDAAGTCNPQGQCAASPIGQVDVCSGDPNGCPGGYYKAAFDCSGFCPQTNGQCVFCVNQIHCAYACTQTLTACCGNDCNTACPVGYHIISGPTKVAGCSCIPADAVQCSL